MMNLNGVFQYIIVVIIGWITGAIVNYFADVLPIKRRLATPFCVQCDCRMNYGNYFLGPRRCSACGQYRERRTWWVEIAFMIISLWLWAQQPSNTSYFVSLILFAYFGIIIIIDVEHRLIMHSVSIVGALLGGIIGIWWHGLRTTLLGGFVGFTIMFLLYYFGILFMSWLARRRGFELGEEALGFGDVNLGGVIGLFLGWPGIVVGLLVAVIMAGVFSLLYMLYKLLIKQYQPDLAIPYGPFLAISALLLIFFRDTLMRFI